MCDHAKDEINVKQLFENEIYMDATFIVIIDLWHSYMYYLFIPPLHGLCHISYIDYRCMSHFYANYRRMSQFLC